MTWNLTKIDSWVKNLPFQIYLFVSTNDPVEFFFFFWKFVQVHFLRSLIQHTKANLKYMWHKKSFKLSWLNFGRYLILKSEIFKNFVSWLESLCSILEQESGMKWWLFLVLLTVVPRSKQFFKFWHVSSFNLCGCKNVR